MIYVKNLPLWERSLRISLGAAVTVYAVLNMASVWGWLIVTSGAGIALTGIFGFCPACALAGRRLKRHDQQE